MSVATAILVISTVHPAGVVYVPELASEATAMMMGWPAAVVVSSGTATVVVAPAVFNALVMPPPAYSTTATASSAAVVFAKHDRHAIALRGVGVPLAAALLVVVRQAKVGVATCLKTTELAHIK